MHYIDGDTVYGSRNHSEMKLFILSLSAVLFYDQNFSSLSFCSRIFVVHMFIKDYKLFKTSALQFSLTSFILNKIRPN